MIELPNDLADALYNCLLRPQTDNNGQPMYPISVNMALELRRAIADSKERKKGAVK